jgi:hypothetical protein
MKGIPPMSRDPFYIQYAGVPGLDTRPLGAGPAGYGGVIPKMKTRVDARSLGYADPRYTADMQISRREGEDETQKRAPGEVAAKEGSS